MVKGSSSLSHRFKRFSIGMALASLLALAIYGVTIHYIKSGQDEYRRAVEQYDLVYDLKLEYQIMEASDYGFLADPTNNALWTRKIEADEAVPAILEKLKATNVDSSVVEALERTVRIDEELLNPVSKQAADLSKSDRLAAVQLFSQKVMPGYSEAQNILTKALEHIKNSEQKQEHQLVRTTNLGSTLLTLVLLFNAAAVVWFSRRIGVTVISVLRKAVTQVTAEMSKAIQNSSAVSTSSSELAQSVTEQAAALQETAASVDELNAMIKRNAESAMESTRVANESSEVAHQGKRSVGDLISAIEEINQSNIQVLTQIDESNVRLTEITKVIAEIADKTKVINDIVFQTKLLSFNASVEAARAGEHGKGFAVVAEEVGKLAQMSGNAAKEIAEMLVGSIQKVDGLVSETKSKVQNITAGAKDKIAAGRKIAFESGQVLDEIVTKALRVHEVVGEITTATQEQARGVEEIAKAMGQLDTVTQQNSAVSTSIANAAEQLSTQAEVLGAVVRSLEQLVGHSASARANVQLNSGEGEQAAVAVA